MRISGISQNKQKFGLKMTQRYVEQEMKKQNCKQADITNSCFANCLNDNVTLDYKDSKYFVILPQYKIACSYKPSNSYPLTNITKAEFACVKKILSDSLKEKKIKSVAKELIKSFPWEKERILGSMNDMIFFANNK